MTEPKLGVPSSGIDLKDATLDELQAKFNELDVSIRLAEPQVLGMKATYEEAAMILGDLKFRRGKVAYWLTMRKAQR